MSTAVSRSAVPFGYCWCGCGFKTPLAPQTRRVLGWTKGQPIRFISGHNNRQDLAERIRRFTDITSTPDGCHEWTGERDVDRYGLIEVNGHNRRATHIVLELAGFMIPAEGLQVRHYICHNPPCCRLSHLRIGTPQEDADDKVAAGRQARGERNSSAKLQQHDVDEIRRRYAAGDISQSTLARQFRITQSTISYIIAGKTWRHALRPEPA